MNRDQCFSRLLRGDYVLADTWHYSESEIAVGNLAVFIAPIMLVKLIALLGGGSLAPQSAAAGAAETFAAPAPTVSDQSGIEAATEAETAARAHALYLESIEWFASPLRDSNGDQPIVIGPGPETTSLAPPPTCILQAIMGGRTAKALIDGALYKVGDALRDDPTWRIDRIDIDGRIVSLSEGASGRRLTLRVRDPLPLEVLPDGD